MRGVIGFWLSIHTCFTDAWAALSSQIIPEIFSHHLLRRHSRGLRTRFSAFFRNVQLIEQEWRPILWYFMFKTKLPSVCHSLLGLPCVTFLSFCPLFLFHRSHSFPYLARSVATMHCGSVLKSFPIQKSIKLFRFSQTDSRKSASAHCADVTALYEAHYICHSQKQTTTWSLIYAFKWEISVASVQAATLWLCLWKPVWSVLIWLCVYVCCARECPEWLRHPVWAEVTL